MSDPFQDQSKVNSPREAELPRPRIVQSQELMRGETEIFIDHHGETYRLRCTRQGKLILYK
ncbi:MAG: hemin uptake protein HemP [Pirellulaceae bacterium]